ncbi:ABC transporter permease [Thermodesulfobacteriota bacterium]
MMLHKKAYAFIRKDFQNEMSYKLAFLMQLFGIFLSVTMFYFLSQLIGSVRIPALSRYGGNYFAFVLIGIAFSNYMDISLNSMARRIREGQMMGTLEALLSTQTGLKTIIFSSSLYSFIFTSLRVVVFLAIGVVVFSLDLSRANYLGGFIILLLSILAFCSFGILSASFIMIFKRGDPVTRIFSGMSWLLGGIYYPIEILPQWLKTCACILPITYSLQGMRFALLKGYSLGQLLPSMLYLLLFSMVVMPFSLLAFRYAVRLAKRDGSLTQY